MAELGEPLDQRRDLAAECLLDLRHADVRVLRNVVEQRGDDRRRIDQVHVDQNAGDLRGMRHERIPRQALLARVRHFPEGVRPPDRLDIEPILEGLEETEESLFVHASLWDPEIGPSIFSRIPPPAPERKSPAPPTKGAGAYQAGRCITPISTITRPASACRSTSRRSCAPCAASPRRTPGTAFRRCTSDHLPAAILAACRMPA